MFRMRNYAQLSLLVFAFVNSVVGNGNAGLGAGVSKGVESNEKNAQPWFNPDDLDYDGASLSNEDSIESVTRDLQDENEDEGFDPDDEEYMEASPAYWSGYYDYSPAYWSPAYSPAWSPAYAPAGSPVAVPTEATPTLSPTIRPVTTAPVSSPPTTSPRTPPPTPVATTVPTPLATPRPTENPTPRPTQKATPEPTKEATAPPSVQENKNPETTEPTTRSPTKQPTRSPTRPPSAPPTVESTTSTPLSSPSPTPIATTPISGTKSPSEAPRSNWDPTQPPTMPPTLPTTNTPLSPTSPPGPSKEVSVRTNPIIATFAGDYDFDADGGLIFALMQMNLYLYMKAELRDLLQDLSVTILATKREDDKPLFGGRKLAEVGNGTVVHALMTVTMDIQGEESAVNTMTQQVATDKVKGFFEGEPVKELRTVLVKEGIQMESIRLSSDEDIEFLDQDSPENDSDSSSGDWKKPLLIALVSICGTVFVAVSGFLCLEYRRQRKMKRELESSVNGDWAKLNDGSVDPGSKSKRRKTKLERTISRFTKEARRASSSTDGSGASRKSNVSPYLEEGDFPNILPSADNSESSRSKGQENARYNGSTWETEESSDLLAVAAMVGASAAARDTAASDISGYNSGTSKSRWSRSLTQQLSHEAENNRDEDQAVYLVPLDDDVIDSSEL